MCSLFITQYFKLETVFINEQEKIMSQIKIIVWSIFGLLLTFTTNAAIITVTASDGLVVINGECSISEAIVNANNDAQTHSDCTAGAGADTINLSQDITLNSAYENDATYGRTGTPPIATEIFLVGNGFTLKRDDNLSCILNQISTVNEFRLLRTTQIANLILQNITLTNGCADGNEHPSRGGGLYNEADLTIIDSVFGQNQSQSIGGGIYHGYGNLELIRNSLFVNNHSVNVGGAIVTFQSPINHIENSTFSGNSALFGGAIFNSISTIGFILNSTFSGNSAVNGGGAIYTTHSSSSITLNNSLFNNNGSSECISDSGIFTGSNNISNNFLSVCPGIIFASLNTNSVAPLADNGGPTMTHALLVGSAAIDAADTVTNTGTATSADQRGTAAIGIRDIGAYEHHAIFDQCPSALKIDGFITTVSNDAELIEAITCANLNGNIRDSITLSQDIVLSENYENNELYGRTGTPAIDTSMLLDGNGFTLERDDSLSCDLNLISTDSEFRVLRTTTGADLTLQNITIKNGCVDGETEFQRSGGGIYNNASLIILDTFFIQNQVSLAGGGIYQNFSTIALISNSTFADNSALFGGGITNINGSITNIENSTFSGNSASYSGGAIYSEFTIIGTIINSTFSGNSASYTGGAIQNLSTSIDAILSSTFSGNSAQNSGAISNSNSTITALNNSLFHNNIGWGCDNIIGTFNGANNISDNPSGGYPGLIATTLSSNSVGPLADNGGPTLTHALLLGSEAIDVADTVTNTGTATSTDQRGFATDNIRDIGAYEVQVPVVTVPANIILEATGATTAVSLGSATVIDVDEAGLSANPDISGPFAVGEHTITWSAIDSQGHAGSAIQTVTITDNTAPTITLNDSTSVLIVIGGSYSAGATANDLVDGDLTSAIITGGNTVDVNTAGIYVVTYSVTDQANNTTQTVQTVNVQASVEVTVSGLHANGLVDLTSNGQILMFTNNGTSSFAPFDNGTVYAASVISQPTSPNQTCVITGGSNNDGSGVIAGNNVELSVTCTTNVYFIGGMTTGLIPDNNLVLQNNLGDDLLIADDGAFVFVTGIEDLQSYDITIFLQPDDPIQNCSISNTGGNIAGTDVIDVSIDCEFGDDLIYRHGFEDTPAITAFDLGLKD